MNKDVPNIDRMAGIEIYSTKFDGIGGSIKVKNEDFKVLELLVESISRDMSRNSDNSYRFPVLLLQKKDWILITPLLRYLMCLEQGLEY